MRRSAACFITCQAGMHRPWTPFGCAGTIVTFNIQNNYNTYRFGGHKVMPLLPCSPHG